jgi:putative NADH-flavin reductase
VLELSALGIDNRTSSDLLYMKLFVIGATGRTGSEIVRLALSGGHDVTAFARSPEKIPPAASLSAVRGDPRDPESIASALDGNDAVLSAIGPHPRDVLRRSTLLTDCARATVEAMKANGVARLGIVSAGALFPRSGLYFAFFRVLAINHVRDLRSMEHVVRTSGLEWTIARPPRLMKSPRSTYHSRVGAVPDDRHAMSFRAVAAFLLDSVEHRAHIGEVVGLAR